MGRKEYGLCRRTRGTKERKVDIEDQRAIGYRQNGIETNSSSSVLGKC